MRIMNNNLLGIGTDIIEIERFEKTVKRTPQVLDKLFTKKEQKYCLSKGKNKILHFAGRFTAKEAIVKALGTGFGRKISFLDLEIINNHTGQPTVLFSDKLKKYFPNIEILLSISHSKTVAVASALACKISI